MKKDGSIWTKRILTMIGLFIGSFIINDARGQELENTLLWKVEGDSIQTSYVFGTFHLLPQADFVLKDKVKSAFDESELIVMELDMDDPSMQAELMKNVIMKDGQSLDKLLTAEEYKELDSYMTAKTGVGLAPVNRLKPFFVAAMVLPKFIEGTPASYEMTFVQRAMSSEKEILGLETATEQASVFDEIPYDVQAKDLLRMSTEEQEMMDLFQKMIKTYRKEDVDKMYELVVENTSDESQVKYLLIDRNLNWIPKMANYSKEKSTFYAVGAGHLGGAYGVIQLLKVAGYKVTPVFE